MRIVVVFRPRSGRGSLNLPGGDVDVDAVDGLTSRTS